MRFSAMALVSVAFLGFVGPAFAQVHVDGYTRRDGTYMAPHYRSSPDSTPFNNYSTRGNVNPYTGQVGTVNPYSDRLRDSSSYGRLGSPRNDRLGD